MNYRKLREEPLKNAVRDDYFKAYKYTQIDNIDFVIAKHNTERGMRDLFEDVCSLNEVEMSDLKSILWAEAKQGTTHDIYESFVQLILTIGKERTFEKFLPPKYIGAFDAEKFAFIEYHEIQHIFYQNDFNWNVTPSNHESKEFRLLYELCENLLAENSIFFKYETQSAELKEFIRLNFKTDKDVSEKISVTKNNFTFVFQKWTKVVKPTINVDWEKANKAGIISADFFLADLLSNENESLKDSLYVVLKKTKYELAKKIDELGFETASYVGFTDRQKAYKEFWSIYARPPKEEYWDYIIGRRDLLVPQDIRERKGSFFTPQIWVEKSQQYLADVLGETWQDEYYIWDCCAGTGNLLNGLTNYRNVFASTLDKQDVDVMKDRIKNGWNMFDNHVFQFDFLNDDFTKCPEELREILASEEKRKKLVIYINPPYAEAGTSRTKTQTGQNKDKVAKENKVFEKYKGIIGTAANEVFAEFLIRVNAEIQCCKLAQFATLKALCAPNFAKFRNVFRAELKSLFVVPGNTFDNVNGQFPIGFAIWDIAEKRIESSLSINADVYDRNGNFIGQKLFFTPPTKKLWMDWVKTMHDKQGKLIGHFRTTCSDFQNQNGTFITSQPSANDILQVRTHEITKKNFVLICIAFATRMCIEPTWLNDRDQFLYPNDGWQKDREFHGDCLIYTLFHGQNRISVTSTSLSDHTVGGHTVSERSRTNHWIPFTEQQVGCKKSFKSTFMADFIKDFLAGKIDAVSAGSAAVFEGELFADGGGVTGAIAPVEGAGGNGETIAAEGETSPIQFSEESQAVYDAGLELWKYYHSQRNANPDASFYDIRRFFQGESKGRMNASSDDETYTELIGDLRSKQKALAKKIEACVYKYGFLK